MKDLLPSGHGEYSFSNGTIYRGDFSDGEFHGSGTLFYPNGSKYVAKWERGKLVPSSGVFYFPDNLPYGSTKENIFLLPPSDSGSGSDADAAQAKLGDLDWRAAEWKYCTPSDRRYWSEIQNGIQVNRSVQLTDRTPPPRLPLGCLDVGDGYLVEAEKRVYHYNGLFNRVSNDDELRWAKEKCRIGVDASVVHKPIDMGAVDFAAPVNKHEKKNNS